ncbi:MAG: hypothetical protein PHT95_04495, partial [Candidatus Omnitrophica bacterium]|nr:hypothetical protein [Candidatus Omnitrophota bacterium]
DPHNYNDLEYDANQLDSINTFDITKYPYVNVDQWKSESEKKQDEKTGLDYWVGFSDEKTPGDERLIKYAVYTGDAEKEKIEYVLSGYVLNVATGKYEPKYRTDYTYQGDAIAKTLRYLIWGDQEILLEESIFEGDKENNKIVQRINYDKETGEVASRQDYVYDGDKKLTEMRDYDTGQLELDANGNGVIDPEEDTDGDGMLGGDFDTDGDGIIDDVDGDGVIGDDPRETGNGRLTSVTYFVGEKDKEVADYTVSFTKDGKVLSTIINYYRGDKRASELSDEAEGYREPKERVVAYRGEIDPAAVDADGDGILDGYENNLTSISRYHTALRLPGEEVLDYQETYARGAVIQSTVYYYGEEEVRADTANYRLPMSKSVTYWGDYDKEGDGLVDADAREKSVTYYYITERLKGEESADYTVKRSIRGDVTSTLFYYYEGNKRAADSEATDRMSKNATYRGLVDPSAVDADGDGVLDGYETQLASVTYFDYLGREKGEEVMDYTEKYNTRQQIMATTIYLYEDDLKRAIASGNDDRMRRSVTYRGTIDPLDLDLDGDGELDSYEDKLDSITYYNITSSDGTERLKGEEVMDFTEKFDSRQSLGTTTVYYYEDALRAELADSYDRMSKSVTYRGGLDTDNNEEVSDAEIDAAGSKISSITYYDYLDRVKGEEVMDFTEKFDSRQNIANTTVYYYEDGSRAEDAWSDDRMSKSITFRGGIDTNGDNVLSGAEIESAINANLIASITYYSITSSDGTERLKGEEVMDFTEKYDSRGAVTSTTLYLYEDTVLRAEESDSYDRMRESVTYRGDLDANNDGVITAAELEGAQIASITYYNITSSDGVERLKGEEVMDFTEKYDSTGDVTSTTVYLYEDALLRASGAGHDDRMRESVTYRGDLDANNDGVITAAELEGAQIASITYYNITTSDGTERLKGEEVMDFTEKYDSRGVVTNTTLYLYEDVLLRAEGTGSEDRMRESVTYRGDLDANNDGVITAGELEGAQIASITYYNITASDGTERLKGEEVMDFTEKYDSTGAITSTTVYLYEDELLRANAAGSDDRMRESVTYRGDLDADNDGVITAGELEGAQIASITYYNITASDGTERLKGEEVMDFTEKYDSRGDVNSTTLYLYEDELLRANAAGSEDRMRESVTYRGDLDANNDGVITAGELEGTQIASITYYNITSSDGIERLKGEEVMDFTEKYDSRGSVNTTTVYLYEDALLRANDAGHEDRMRESVTYRGDLDANNDGVITAAELEGAQIASITYYNITTSDGTERLKGEEVMDFTEKYDSTGKITSTTLYLYEDELLRANAAGYEDRMRESVTYRGDLDADNDGVITAGELEGAQIASITYYNITASDGTERLKGEEVMDFTEKYDSTGAITSTTVYLYEDELLRANAAGSDDRMRESVTYRGDLDADNDGVITAGELEGAQIASITYYNITASDGTERLKGEEVMDFTEKYDSRGDVNSTTLYLYEDELLRANAAGSEDRMRESVTYRGDLDANNDGVITAGELEGTQIASITYYNITSSDGIERLKG